VPCLHDAAWSGDWQAWLDHAAPGVNIAHAGPVYSLYSLALEEARNGAGVLIGHEVLVRAHLEAGTLVAPFAPRLELPRHITITSANPIPPGTTSAGIIDHLGH
jgi:LysR family glycine cleavage system transcriptional activator